MSKKEPVIDTIAIWVHYAEENDMTYGQCKAAVKDGLLPPPDLTKMPPKKPPVKREESPVIIIQEQVTGVWRQPNAKCEICGDPFFRLGRTRTCSKPACKEAARKKYNTQRAKQTRERKTFQYGLGVCVVCMKKYQKFRPDNVCCCKTCARAYHGWNQQKRDRAKAEAQRLLEAEEK